MTSYADGEWHRLHPATPLLKGGIALLAVIGFIIVQLRDALINIVLGGPDDEDPFTYVTSHGLFWVVVGVILGGLIVFVGVFYLSWRMHSFRITDEVVEVRSGILSRTNRKARLDRIQGINIGRPFLARLFGAARLEVNVAGQDGNVQLAYLGSASADALRAEILRLASGTQEQAVASAQPAADGVLQQRVTELLSPELDPALAPPESIVNLNLGRVIGSLALSNVTLVIIGVGIATCVSVAVTGEAAFLFFLVPGLISMVSFYYSRFVKALRFTIAGTPDGVRIGFGLLSTSNETLPPGRIHSVQVSQPLLWRLAGWWEVKVNRASTSSARGAAGQANTTILPVGNVEEVLRVLALVLPDADQRLLAAGLTDDEGYTNSPRRAAIVRWFSWRRNGFAITDSAVLLRTGRIWRALVVVPLARMQSVALEIGPIERRLRIASLRVHTVAGPITPAIGAIAIDDARGFFAQAAEAGAASRSSDTSQHWGRSG